MRAAPNPLVEKYRQRTGRMGTSERWGNNGLFIVPGLATHRLLCIVSDGEGWEHVSVSLTKKQRLPLWEEMCYVKDLFWEAEEVVIQYHPRASAYINFTEALHMWRPLGVVLPEPPTSLVGPKDMQDTLTLLSSMFTKER